MTEKVWYTIAEVAAILHVQKITAWRIVRPYRARCHLGRDQGHPRRRLYVPATVVSEIAAARSIPVMTDGLVDQWS